MHPNKESNETLDQITRSADASMFQSERRARAEYAEFVEGGVNEFDEGTHIFRREELAVSADGRGIVNKRNEPGVRRCAIDLDIGPVERDGLPHFKSMGFGKNQTYFAGATVQELTNVAPDQILTVTEPRRPVLALEAIPDEFTRTLKADSNLRYHVFASEDVAAGWTVLTSITSDATGTGY